MYHYLKRVMKIVEKVFYAIVVICMMFIAVEFTIGVLTTSKPTKINYGEPGQTNYGKPKKTH